MHLFIIGAPASGKMTIGQELSRLTDSTLFYNHQAIDFALEIYQDYTEEMWEFVRGMTFSFLGASARNQRSVILTDVIDFSNQYQLIYLKQIQDLLNDYHQEILFVELETSLEERLRRNRTENRLKHKPLKRHIEVSEREILDTAETLQLNSQHQPNELHHYLKINNTNLSAEEVAKQIQDKMNTIEKGQTHMSKELSPKYNPAEVEAGRYQKWLDADVFKPSGDQKAKPYSIVIPPPNVTGKLHLGHAWDTTLQDIIIRQKRMQGFDTLWLPGMDHAGIATQAKVEERLHRNQTENRLKHKPLKRHIEVSEREILETAETLQLNSQHQPNELHHYLKINNTNLSAAEVAKQIQDKMNTIEKGQTHV